MDKQRIKIGRTLRRMRKARRMRLREISDPLGVSATAICNIESGKNYPGIPTLYGICKVMEVSVEDFMRECGM